MNSKTQTFNVLQLIPNMVSGGVEKGTLEVANALTSAGHGSYVISGGGRLVEALTAGGSHHTQWPIGKKSPITLRFGSKLRRFIKENQIDIVHARSRVPAWLAHLSLQKLRENRPVFITTCHGLHSVSKYSAIMGKGDVAIAVSETVKTYLTTNYQVPTSRIKVIPRGVSPEQFPYQYQPASTWIQDFENTHPQVKGARKLLLAGRLTRLKGHLELVALIGRLKAEYEATAGERVVALFVGDEDPRRKGYAEEVKAAIENAGLSDHILLTGHRSDIRELMSYCDITYSTNKKPESFGRTVVEAISLGKPVIGYAHGGVKETMSTLLPEGLVPIQNADELFKKTVQFLKSPPKIINSNPYTLERMLCSVIETYQEALASRQS